LSHATDKTPLGSLGTRWRHVRRTLKTRWDFELFRTRFRTGQSPLNDAESVLGDFGWTLMTRIYGIESSRGFRYGNPGRISAMFQTLRKSPVLWLLPVFYLMSAGGVGHGMVLCFNGNHVAIEPSHQTHVACDTTYPSRPEKFSAPSADEHPTEGCLDVVLLGKHGQPVPVRVDRMEKEATSAALMAMPAMRLTDPLRIPSAGGGFISTPTSLISPPLHFLRTVILLI
jgi:hypothetical protein